LRGETILSFFTKEGWKELIVGLAACVYVYYLLSTSRGNALKVIKFNSVNKTIHKAR